MSRERISVFKRPSLTDWCLAAFTGVLTVVAIYQLVTTDNQLVTMRKDQRPWVKVGQRCRANFQSAAECLGKHWSKFLEKGKA